MTTIFGNTAAGNTWPNWPAAPMNTFGNVPLTTNTILHTRNPDRLVTNEARFDFPPINLNTDNREVNHRLIGQLNTQLNNLFHDSLSILEEDLFISQIRNSLFRWNVHFGEYVLNLMFNRTLLSLATDQRLFITIHYSTLNLVLNEVRNETEVPLKMEPTRHELKLSVWQRTEEFIEKWQPKKFASTEFIPGISEGEIRVCDVGIAWVNKVTMKVSRIMLPQGLSKLNLNLIRYRFRQMGLQVRATGRHEIIEHFDQATKTWLNERLYYGKPYYLPPYIEKNFGPYKSPAAVKVKLTEQLNLALPEIPKTFTKQQLEEFNRMIRTQPIIGTATASAFPYNRYVTGNTYGFSNITTTATYTIG